MIEVPPIHTKNFLFTGRNEVVAKVGSPTQNFNVEFFISQTFIKCTIKLGIKQKKNFKNLLIINGENPLLYADFGPFCGTFYPI